MKPRNIILLLFILLFSATVSAQIVDVSDIAVKKIDNNVTISFSVEATKISANSMLTMTPVLWSDNNRQSLSKIVIQGRNRAIMDSRKAETLESTDVLGRSQNRKQYETTIPFEEWMRGATLSMDRVSDRCSRKKRFQSVDIVNNVLEATSLSVVPIFGSNALEVYLAEFQESLDDSAIVYFIGSKGAIDADSKGLFISFRQGSSVVDESYMDNQTSIRKMRETIKLINSNANVYVAKLIITGGSSPEGSSIYNEKISQDRAESLVDYFSADIDSDIFEIENIGENWLGLVRMVKSSDMAYRDEVLYIIDNYSVANGRERRLMELAGGNPYRYMLKEFFPELRKASSIKVLYDIHPNGELITVDKASEAIQLGDYRRALNLLKDVEPTPYTDNLKGVCYMMIEDAGSARVYFQRAIDGGNSDAQKNLNALNSLSNI